MTNNRAKGLLAGMDAGHKQAAQDAKRAADGHRREVALMALDDVLPRPGGLDTRQADPAALDALEESIKALGLLEPIVVDRLGVLLCGKHRLIALRRLAAKEPGRWDAAPVRRLDFIAQDDPTRALAVEVAENEKRKDYNAAEIRALADRLRVAGFRDKPGRPRKGDKALLPALGAVVGKSKRQLLRTLNPAPDLVPADAFDAAADKLAAALRSFDNKARNLGLNKKQKLAAQAAEELAALLADAKGDK